MLKGRNITLRPLQNSDLDFLFTIENNKELWRYGSEQKQFTKSELSSYIVTAETDITISQQYRFVIDLNYQPIGFIDLFDYNVESSGVGVIIDKHYRKNGYATEALRMLIEYAFGNLKLKQLNCKIAADNIASIRLFTSCYFDFIKLENKLNYYSLKNV